MAPQITVVSAERIADEMRRMLVPASRVRAVMLLRSTGLLAAILPEAETIAAAERWPSEIAAKEFAANAGSAEVELPPTLPPTLALLQAIETPTFPLALAALLHKATGERVGKTLGHRWRLARAETERLSWLLSNQNSLTGASQQKWSQIQPLLVHDGARKLVDFYAAKAAVANETSSDVEFFRQWLARPAAELDPPPLVTGGDLHAMKIPAGPIFAKLLQAARDAQLDGIVSTRESALALVQKLWQEQAK
jgi:poly(A) polymerase